RARDPEGARAAGGGSDRVRDRAPPVDAAEGVAAVRDRRRAADRARDACGTLGARRGEVSEAVRFAGSARVIGVWYQVPRGCSETRHLTPIRRNERRGSMESTLVRRTDDGPARDYAGALSLEWRADGSLWAMKGEEERAVSVRRCFPWSEPGQHLSLRDADEEEFALVRNPAELDPRSRAALERALAVAGFVFEVTRVLEIEEEVEIRRWP